MRGRKIIESNSIILAEEAIRVAKKCRSRKCKITVKGYDGEVEQFAIVEKK